MRRSERIAAIITSLGGVAVMVYAWHTLKLGSIHTPDAGLLPFLCGMGLAVLGVVWLLILRWRPVEAAPAGNILWHRPLLALLLMVSYGWAMEVLGYITSTLLFMTAWQQLIERERWVKTLGIAVLATLAMYALFVFFLKVPVPREFFVR